MDYPLQLIALLSLFYNVSGYVLTPLNIDPKLLGLRNPAINVWSAISADFSDIGLMP